MRVVRGERQVLGSMLTLSGGLVCAIESSAWGLAPQVVFWQRYAAAASSTVVVWVGAHGVCISIWLDGRSKIR